MITMTEIPIGASCWAAFAIRVLLILYGEIQDRMMVVKYTDIDYHVFTDAARYVTQGESPYQRATYRYTPILAFMLTPNIWLSPLFGKLLFCIFDIIAGLLIYDIIQIQSYSVPTATKGALVWLFNPLTAAISSRGNAESIMAVLVLLVIRCLLKRQTKLCALTLALSVHFKIYPLTYCLPIYFYVTSPKRKFIHRFIWTKSKNILERFLDLFWPTKERIEFVAVFIVTFAALTAVMYHWYGDEFLSEAYLYHVTRRDVRHNFSPFFYMLYLTSDWSSSFLLGLLAFVPQVVLLVAFSLVYYRDIAFCCFAHTFVFVTFNKVCTSQYFLWYLTLLPLILPATMMSIKEGVCLITAWFLAQALWLLPAYYLEFEGKDTFIFIWLAGLTFFFTNVYILVRLILTRETFTQNRRLKTS
ncbi:GPI mannosyltransferase 1-like [Strongylocentrotus purpuratus]|uniref:GPI alpha-1,4-mannosyltransferase I, catalytic subunit n=1 Tax=Strongylocentrotus purpuratus TaxID=7668 RepID=A0A7M7TGN4_STRPU|nr:GPI mannosyltransferase 1-like [Strongylocentrotus purpuratus]|eukprot:XP_785435.3 PREDICTED: GPI mannosyltransferase 1-like [Strongylocentrotus purpuratus]